MHTPLRFKLCVLSIIALLGVLLTADTWAARPAFSLPPHARAIAENIYDLGCAMHNGRQVYDDRDFVWGDTDSNIKVMGLLNIAVHEVGHAAGLGHPDLTCTEETMYAYAAEGETEKRDLNDGDIAGIQELYR